MDQVVRTVQLFIIILLTLTMVYNINSGLIRFPGEPNFSKFGFSLYIPLFTSLILSVMLTVALNYFKPI